MGPTVWLRSGYGESLSTSLYKRPEVLCLDLMAEPDSWPLDTRANVAVIAAGMTSQGQCMENPSLSQRVNVDNTVELIWRLRERGVRVVYLSSNLVFDGARPHENADAPRSPCGLYGAQKVAVEEKILAFGEGVSVLRMSKVLGKGTKLFEFWTAEIQAGRQVTAFHDLVVSPIHIDFAASVILRLCFGEHKGGIYQLSATHDISYAEVAGYICCKMGHEDLVQAVSAIDSGVSPTAIVSNTTLDCSRIARDLGVLPPDPFQTLDRFLAQTTTNAIKSDSRDN